MPDLTVSRWIKAFREGREPFKTEGPHVENNTIQFLASLLDADPRWTARELGAEVDVCHGTVLHILHDILVTVQFQRVG